MSNSFLNPMLPVDKPILPFSVSTGLKDDKTKAGYKHDKNEPAKNTNITFY